LGEKAFKGEKVKGWKSEKMAAPFKDERVKRWLRTLKVKK